MLVLEFSYELFCLVLFGIESGAGSCGCLWGTLRREVALDPLVRHCGFGPTSGRLSLMDVSLMDVSRSIAKTSSAIESKYSVSSGGSDDCEEEMGSKLFVAARRRCFGGCSLAGDLLGERTRLRLRLSFFQLDRAVRRVRVSFREKE